MVTALASGETWSRRSSAENRPASVNERPRDGAVDMLSNSHETEGASQELGRIMTTTSQQNLQSVSPLNALQAQERFENPAINDSEFIKSDEGEENEGEITRIVDKI